VYRRGDADGTPNSLTYTIRQFTYHASVIWASSMVTPSIPIDDTATLPSRNYEFDYYFKRPLNYIFLYLFLTISITSLLVGL